MNREEIEFIESELNKYFNKKYFFIVNSKYTCYAYSKITKDLLLTIKSDNLVDLITQLITLPYEDI